MSTDPSPSLPGKPYDRKQDPPEVLPAGPISQKLRDFLSSLPPEVAKALPPEVLRSFGTLPPEAARSFVFAVRSTTRSGPIPDSQELRDLKDVHKDAPRIILQQYAKQGDHRRQIESSVIETKNKALLRGQNFAFTLGMTGIVGGFALLFTGKSIEGFSSLFGSILSLVAVFIYGNRNQEKELNRKAELRKKMTAGDRVEEIEKKTDQTE